MSRQTIQPIIRAQHPRMAWRAEALTGSVSAGSDRQDGRLTNPRPIPIRQDRKNWRSSRTRDHARRVSVADYFAESSAFCIHPNTECSITRRATRLHHGAEQPAARARRHGNLPPGDATRDHPPAVVRTRHVRRADARPPVPADGDADFRRHDLMPYCRGKSGPSTPQSACERSPQTGHAFRSPNNA